MEARGTLGVQMQNRAHFAKIPPLFQNGNQSNLSVLGDSKRPKIYLAKTVCTALAAVRHETSEISQGDSV
jgi:hypothetical protein